MLIVSHMVITLNCSRVNICSSLIGTRRKRISPPGIDVEDEINNSVLERGAQHRYIVRSRLNLEASSLLILRKSNDKNWSHQQSADEPQ